MSKLVVLSGAGISEESGIKTFRDSGGLWEGYDVMEVASPEGWQRNQSLVLQFYNERRKQLLEVTPNPAHSALAEFENLLDVTIITQNIDNLHERAGSKRVIHLHGELLKARSTYHEDLIYPWEKDINIGDNCEKGFQLRPHIVWFGEQVPMIEAAAQICQHADYLIVVGTSLSVYPAAGLIHYAPLDTRIFYVDPHAFSTMVNISNPSRLSLIAEKASEGIPKALKMISEMEGL